MTSKGQKYDVGYVDKRINGVLKITYNVPYSSKGGRDRTLKLAKRTKRTKAVQLLIKR